MHADRRNIVKVCLWLSFVCGTVLLLFYVSAEIAKKKFRPIHYEEYKFLEKEIYTFFNFTGHLPRTEELSKKSKDIAFSSNGINYDYVNGLRFSYDKHYPVNVPVSALLTAGTVHWPKGTLSNGSTQGPTLLERNAGLMNR